MPKSILVVDDDPHIREVIVFALENAGMSTAQAEDGAQALSMHASKPYDLIVLDINMPEMDGLELCKTLRKDSDIPILFLSSRDEEIDRILGLELGADDYLPKPFSTREMVARVKAILKRCQPKAASNNNDEILKRGALTLDPTKHAVDWDGEAITLTAKEFAILNGMLKTPEAVYTRDQIIDMAYDHNIHVSDRTIDSHIRHIRQKFAVQGCETLIETLHGVGYKLKL